MSKKKGNIVKKLTATKSKSAKAVNKGKAKGLAPKKVAAKKLTPSKGKEKKVVLKKEAPKKTSSKVVSTKKLSIKVVDKKKEKVSVGKSKVDVKLKNKKVKEIAKPEKKSDKKEETKKAKTPEINKTKAKAGVEVSKVVAEKVATKPKRGRGKKKKKGDDDDEPAIDVNDAFLQEILETVKPKKKLPKVPKQIRTFTNPRASLTVAQISKDAKKAKVALKEPKGKFELEYVIGTSPAILYEFLTTPSGLSEWFADDVNISDGVFTFDWDGSVQKALLLDFKEEKFIRFQWLDKPAGSYFEFKIQIDELTSDLSLIITDFADEGSDLQTSKLLWDSQIHALMNVIGSY